MTKSKPKSHADACNLVTRRDVIKATAGIAAAGVLGGLPRLGLGRTRAHTAAKSVLGENKKAGELLFTFVASADPHLGQTRPGHPSGTESFEIMLDKIQALPRKPDFLLIAGDLVLADKGRWLRKAERICPVHVAHGNKEGTESRKICRELFPADLGSADFYSFGHKRCQFICVSNAIYGDHFGHFSTEMMTGKRQVEWVEKQLSERPRGTRHVFLFGHVPPHPETKDWNMYIAINDQKWFGEVVRKHKPTAMFFGHLHRRLRFAMSDTAVYVLRSTNWNFNDEPNGAVVVSVYEKGIRTRFLPIGYRGGSGKIKSREN